MRRFLAGGLLGAAMVAVALAAAARRPAQRPLAATTFIDSVREAAKLEALEVEMHQVVTFVPEPPAAETIGTALKGWIKDLVAHEEGKAMVFATARYMVDLSKLDERSVVVRGTTAYVSLPPVLVSVEIDPEETVVFKSTLSPGGETVMLARAKDAFVSRARSDGRLLGRARAATERAIASVLARFGFTDVRFEEPRIT